MEALDFLTSIEIWQVVLLIIGLALVIVEMINPGFGAPGITGTILIVASVILISNNFIQALLLIIIIISVLAIALHLVLHSARNGRLSKFLILKDSLKKESGYTGNEDLDYFLGKEGIANTVLRPAGTADINGVKLDVVSEGEFIQKGVKVKISKVEGRRIVVRQI